MESKSKIGVDFTTPSILVDDNVVKTRIWSRKINELVASFKISKRLTRAIDYNRSTEGGKATPKDRLCIEILEQAEGRDPLLGEASVSLAMASDDLRTKLLYLENRGVEIAGALKNVLAIAAGTVEGLNLGNNSMEALVSQGCYEIGWLATKMGAKSTTLTGLSGTGDIMLTCFVNLSRNRTVGVRLGSGEKLDDILSSMNQVAEGVSTAGV